MEYIIIPAKNKVEKDFFLQLLNKMHVNPSIFSASEMEDFALLTALKESETSGEGNLETVMEHLTNLVEKK